MNDPTRHAGTRRPRTSRGVLRVNRQLRGSTGMHVSRQCPHTTSGVSGLPLTVLLAQTLGFPFQVT